ncbi:MAG: DUF401 family protein [Candidatus Eremiobacteraeota bacterium]|nr:DUF401 family protein [Candidatus Eremiobacteraeota bacterium]
MKDLIALGALFALILILLRKKLPLGPVMLIATLFLGLCSSFSLSTFLKVTVTALTDKTTLVLLAFLYLVALLEKIITTSGKLDRMIAAMERYIPGRRLRLVIMPAFLGFLASPGGAMFSAPFVEKASETLGLSGEEKTFINYWFRHIWEGFLPLYPATILAASILDVPLEKFIVRMFPMTVAAVAGGVLFGLIPLKLKKREVQGEKAHGRLIDLISGVFPVAAVLILVIVFKLNAALSLLAVVIYEYLASRIPLQRLPGIMKKSVSFSILLAVIAILIFKEALEASSIAPGLSQYLGHLGIPIPLMFFLIPLVVGFLTGLTQAPVGIAFPLLLGMAPMPESLDLFCFAFACAYAGVLLSPTHLCLILTAEYFGVEFTKLYRFLALPVTLLLIAAFLLYVR